MLIVLALVGLLSGPIIERGTPLATFADQGSASPALSAGTGQIDRANRYSPAKTPTATRQIRRYAGPVLGTKPGRRGPLIYGLRARVAPAHRKGERPDRDLTPAPQIGWARVTRGVTPLNNADPCGFGTTVGRIADHRRWRITVISSRSGPAGGLSPRLPHMTSTSWLNCSKAYRRGLQSIANRGPTEAEARAVKAQRAEERRRAKAAGEVPAVRTVTGAEL
jgi:hypothetical protein